MGGTPQPHGGVIAPPFQPGNPHTRRSKAVDKAIRLARQLTPEAIEECARVMRASEDERVRLKAAEIILTHGMPKGDAALRAIMETEVGAITIHIADHRVTQVAPAQAPAEDLPPLTISIEPIGNAD